MTLGIIAIAIVTAVWYLKNGKAPLNEGSDSDIEFDPKWRAILLEKVTYYNALTPEEKLEFEDRMADFLGDVKVTGIEVLVDDTDRVLVAASAIIPIFGFKNWRYNNINEVLLYPSSFNHRFETSGPDRQILGMVGEGAMNGTMILSKPALIQGFVNESDKQNTAIHEFVHLIDKSDGAIDGIPELLLNKQYTIPWINLIAQKIEQINYDKSDINPYGGTSHTEFFAVASEYFFERPQLLESKHPQLYAMLEQMFKQDMSERKLAKIRKTIGRNDPCHCNSNKKYKNCCGVLSGN